MIKKYFLTLLVFSLAIISRAQSTHDVMVGGAMDLIKTDIKSAFNKAQFGFEANYFVVRHFAVGAGAEIWTTNQKNSFMMGMRWYANDHVFLRFRGLIGANDATIGLGYAKPINKNVLFESMGDFYFKGQFGLRFGLSFILK
ncbi:MAG TPA: hypothetical protein VGQ59_03665 [Cyclobacteriaceae bacterium]|jgi:hypothetical protein|nr:hypothetical protein [Cyclobacteriaceae bacterium]